MSYEEAKSIMWIGLAIFLVLLGLGCGYMLYRLGRVFRRIEKDIHRTVDGVMPVISEAETSMLQVNRQLLKFDEILDSATRMTQASENAVKAISHLITEPAKMFGGGFYAASEAAMSFTERMRNDGERPTQRTRDSEDNVEQDNETANNK